MLKINANMAPLKQRNTARADRPLPNVSAISGAPMLLLAGAATVLWTAASSLLAPRLLPLPRAPKSRLFLACFAAAWLCFLYSLCAFDLNGQ